ncbi:MAG: enoyl-CoA hydratase [Candidatus Hydrogenedentes bacterium]|nr:enoyl-CoA hydratase [Candidatus Hydrogenedentota bacterium]
MSGSDHILVTRADYVMTLQINRPEKKNALTVAMYQTLADSLRAAEADPSLRAVVIRGTGDVFTSGNDLMDFMQNPPTGDDSSVGQFLKAIVTMKKPLIGIVEGMAIGIGTTMLLHCDLVYVGANARLKLPFVTLGLCPEGASSLLLPRLVGTAKASELLLLGEAFDGAEAVSMGLANAQFPSEELVTRAMAEVAKVVAQPPEAVRVSKELIRGRDREAIGAVMKTEFEQFMGRLTSPEAAEAFQAFAEKRAPDFSTFS